MSSKLYRSGSVTEAQPFAWRRHGASPADRPGEPAGAARPNAADLDVQMEARANAAYRQGQAAGEAAAAQRAQARVEPVLASLNSIVAELAGSRARFRAEAEGATVALALAVARRVLNRELATDPEAILGLVKAAFQKCDSRESCKLRLAPADASVVNEYRARLNLPAGLEIISDPNLTRGSAIFETSRGDLDASVETQLSEIERGFADILQKRPR